MKWVRLGLVNASKPFRIHFEEEMPASIERSRSCGPHPYPVVCPRRGIEPIISRFSVCQSPVPSIMHSFIPLINAKRSSSPPFPASSPPALHEVPYDIYNSYKMFSFYMRWKSVHFHLNFLLQFYF